MAAFITKKSLQLTLSYGVFETVVTELRKRGVVFEEYDLPGLKTVNRIADVSGNYPSSGGIGERGSWFRDSEGNLLAIGQPMLRRERQS